MVITGREVDRIRDSVYFATAMACPMTVNHILENVWYDLILNHLQIDAMRSRQISNDYVKDQI